MIPGPARGRTEGGLAHWLREAGRHSLFFDARRRRHLSVLAVILAVLVFVYGLLEPRSVRVVADGQELDIQTRLSSDTAVLSQAGVDLAEGDRITQLDGAGVDVLRVDRARTVRLVVDGEELTLRTHALTIDQVLDEAGVVLAQRDGVLQNGLPVDVNAPVDPPRLLATIGLDAVATTVALAPIELEVSRAVPLTIVSGDREVATTSSWGTVAQVLREAGVVVGPGDRVLPPLDTRISADMRIDVTHARPVTIALPDGHRVVYTLARTVREVLDEEGITLPYGAFVHPSFDTNVVADMEVRVIQLGSSADIEYEPIPNNVVYRTDPSLGPGETYTEEGSDGLITRRYNISYVDGQEVGRELLEETVVDPVDTVVYQPARVTEPPASVAAAPRPDEPAPDGVVGTAMRVYATAYNAASAGRSPDDPNYGITATGVRVTWGVVAVDPSVIPLGTRMYIPGYGYGVAADTGGAVKGYIIDLGYPDGVPIDWETRWMDIYILD